MPVRVHITGGKVADCTEACDLIEGIEAENLIADRGYDTNDIVEAATKAGMHAELYRPKRTERSSAIMIGTSTKFATWLKIHFCI